MEKTNKKTDQKKLEKTTKVFPYGTWAIYFVDLVADTSSFTQKFCLKQDFQTKWNSFAHKQWTYFCFIDIELPQQKNAKHHTSLRRMQLMVTAEIYLKSVDEKFNLQQN